MSVEIRCPKCEANVPVEPGRGAVPCPSCGAAIDRPSPELLTTLPDDPTRPIRAMGQAEPPASGLFAGRYRFLKLLGEGGMGRVELHLDTWMNRKVALKVPNARAVVKPRARQRFLREVQTLVKVRNPNVCHVLDVNVAHDPIFFTMEYLEGESLDQVLDRRGALPPAEAAELVRAVALALADTHDKQVVHRDLKPSNILMVDGRPILIDFGLALDLDDRSVANTGALRGTIQYMSPEQARGDNAGVGPASDIFSLGIILQQLLTGELPFQADSHVGILSQIMMFDPEPPSKVRPGLDPRFDAICARAMDKEIGKRYATMREFADALGAILGPPAKAAPVDPSTWSSIPIEVDPGPPAGRTFPRRLLAVAAVAVILVAMVGIYALRRGPSQHDPGPDPGPVAVKKPDPVPPGKSKTFADSIGLVMVDVPAGSFWMGASDATLGEVIRKFDQADHPRFDSVQPRHKVEITRPFAISAYETTVGQFQAFVDDANYRTEGERSAEGGWGVDQAKKTMAQSPRYTWKRPGFPVGEKYPVCIVSWNDATAFCRWLTRKSRGEGVVYRLPTEAEWEYACRAGEKEEQFYSFGNAPRDLSKYGNYALQKMEDAGRTKVSKKASGLGFDGFLYTAPVGSLRPNAWGLYDMHGNVMEWCSDLFDATYYQVSPAKDPRGPDSIPGEPRRVLRGGAWSQPLMVQGSASRISAEQYDRSANKGFRVVRVKRE